MPLPSARIPPPPPHLQPRYQQPQQRGMQRGQAQALGMPSDVPQTWWEFWASIWSPYLFILTQLQFNATLVCPANTPNNTQDINMTEPFYAFEPRSHGIITATGAAPTFPYRIGLQSGVDRWTNGTIDSGLVTGDYINASAPVIRRWEWPRELAQNDIITVQVDNNYAAGSPAITVDFTIAGYGIRQRPEPLLGKGGR